MIWKLAALYCLAIAVVWGAEPPAGTATPDPIKIGGITVQGSLRARFYDWDWFHADTGNNSYPFSGNLFRISFSQSIESLDWQLEFAAPFLLGLPDNAVAPGAPGQLGFGASYYVANNKSRYAAMAFAK